MTSEFFNTGVLLFFFDDLSSIEKNFISKFQQWEVLRTGWVGLGWGWGGGGFRYIGLALKSGSSSVHPICFVLCYNSLRCQDYSCY